MNAHRVNHGENPELDRKDRDFFFLPQRSDEGLCRTVTDLCARRLPQNMGISPEDVQVLSPTRKGETGTHALNRLLQAALNPPAPDRADGSAWAGAGWAPASSTETSGSSGPSTSGSRI